MYMEWWSYLSKNPDDALGSRWRWQKSPTWHVYCIKSCNVIRRFWSYCSVRRRFDGDVISGNVHHFRESSLFMCQGGGRFGGVQKISEIVRLTKKCQKYPPTKRNLFSMTSECVIELGQKFPETVPKSYATLKITPYEAEFIFRDLRMGNRAQSKIPRNSAKIVRLTKNNPLRSRIYFLWPQNG